MKRAGKDYIVFPLDVPNFQEAMKFVDMLKDHVGLFKVGLELFISEGPAILRAIGESGTAGIFLDLKLHDIPATVKRAFVAASKHSPQFVTVHCDVGQNILKSVAENNPGNTKILAVTVLTSLGSQNLAQLGYSEEYANDISSLVLLRARMAKEAGCHGVICSGKEVRQVKEALGNDFIVMTPGIRPRWSLVQGDDQKRIITPGQAVSSGADYIVVGRPIRDAADPVEAATRIAHEIEEALN